MKNVAKWFKANIPGELKQFCSQDDLRTYLFFNQEDESVISTNVELKPAKDESGLKKDPLFSDALTKFEKELRQLLSQGHVPTSAMIGICSFWKFQLSELLSFQENLTELYSFTPLIVIGYSTEKKIEVSALMGNGKRKQSPKKTKRLAYDLDDTITRWPSFFSKLSQQNQEAGGFNLILSTRHEPATSSSHTAAYQREFDEIQGLGIAYDRLEHAWWDYEASERLFLCTSETEWLKRLIWQKAFYCRLHRIDVFYEDQARNVVLFKKYAPEIEVVCVSQKEELKSSL